ncbi:hypothetical protein ONZ45_g18580 [Pleurotus djamor]|nr:hypothetical protein ONZ45_g18580 [Pleurotus djamor]
MPPHLPNELLLQLIGYFSVTTLIISQGLSKEWRQLVSAAEIHPIRRQLIDIYLSCIDQSWFRDSRPWTVANLRPFERRAYIDALLSQYPYLPESFQIFIMEWPAKAAIGGVWPGLPEVTHDEVGPVTRNRFGRNMLNADKPAIWTINSITLTGDGFSELLEPQPAIPLFDSQGSYTSYTLWLLLDQQERLRGRVLYTSFVNEYSLDIGRDPGSHDAMLLDDWIKYLQWEVDRMAGWRAWIDANPNMGRLGHMGGVEESLNEHRGIYCEPWSPNKAPWTRSF